MKRLLGMTVLAGALLMGSSCGGDGGSTGTGPGTLKVRLTAPAANADSAIIITITGPAALTSVTAGAGLRLFTNPAGGTTTTRYALVGLLANGATILTIGVADVGAVSQYQGTVNGVAQANYQLRAVNGYALALTR